MMECRSFHGMSRFTGGFSVLALLLLVQSALHAQTLRKGPYLIYTGVSTEMQVLWQLDATETCTLEWGEDTSYSTGSFISTEYGLDHQHEHTITELAPETEYFYRVTYGGGQPYTGTFYSAPPADAVNVKFLAYGDTRSYPDDHNAVNGQMINTYLSDPAFQTFTLLAGDLVNAGDNEGDWTTQFFGSTQLYTRELQANLPIQACKGNHEQSGALFYKYFPYPYLSDFYWSFDYGPVHVAVVDQYVSYSPGSAQYNWLENDLASTTKPWKFIILHEPGWSAGGGHGNNTSVQNYIQPLCLTYGVKIVFGGHNHYYARCEVDGVQHITTGGGGAPLSTPEMSYPYLVTAESALHFCEVDIQSDTLTFTVRRVDGTIIESFPVFGPSLKAANPSPPDLAIDVGIDADLGWTAGIGAVSHDVYFGTVDPPPFVWNQTGTTYGPGPLEPDTIYYWRIDEVDAGSQVTTGDPWTFTTALAPTGATNPQPPPGAADVDVNVDLTWTAGENVSSHDVYLGTANPPGFIQNQTGTTYDPGPLSPDTTYYWQIDEQGPGGTAEGPVWEFTTGPAFFDADGEILVAGTVYGDYTDTHASDDSYEIIEERESQGKPSNRYSYLEHKWTITIGAGNEVTFFVEAHHTANSEGDDFVFAYSMDDVNYTDMLTVTKTADDSVPQTYALPASTTGTVYVRVLDTDQTQGNRGLDALSVDDLFIRVSLAGSLPGPASNPIPADTATDVPTTGTLLAWTAGAGAESHDVYFGTNSSPGFVQNQAGTTFDPGPLVPGTVYYWAIDEVNGQGTTPGAVWSFTTAMPCAPETLHVESIACDTEAGSKGNKRGRATVTISDNCGNPVPFAEVTGVFTGDFDETVTATADENGVAILVTAAEVKRPAFTLCVENAIDTIGSPPLSYAPDDNVETCDGY